MASDGDNDGDSVEINRRTVLRGAATSTIGTVAFTSVATAATTERAAGSGKVLTSEEAPKPNRIVENLDNVSGVEPEDCYTEIDCRNEQCVDGGFRRVYERDCCRRGGGYICEDYERTNRCC